MLQMMIFPFDNYVRSLEQKRQEKVIQRLIGKSKLLRGRR